MSTQWLADPSELTSLTQAAWTDRDVSATVGASATGVILLVYNNQTSNHEISFRKNGSTDDFITSHDADMEGPAISLACCGVDGSGIFEYYVENSTDIQVWLVGWFEAEATFFTNAIDKSTATTASYTDVDISSDTSTDTAIAAIIQAVGNEFAWLNMRKNGSTDSDTTGDAGAQTWIVPVDGSEIFEQYIESTAKDIYLVGYITSDWTFTTNLTLQNIATSDTWTTFTAHADATGALAQTDQETTAGAYALRRVGSSWTTRAQPNRNVATWAVKCNVDGEYQGISDATSRDWWEIGYSTASSTVDMNETAGDGTLAILGKAPTITTDTLLTAGDGILEILGKAPSITTSGEFNGTAGKGTLEILGKAPTLIITSNDDYVGAAGKGILDITGYAGVVGASFTIGDIKLTLSGGALNSDVNAALGGVVSSTNLIDSILHNLFDVVLEAESASGDTEYRCVYIRNTNQLTTLESAEIWIEANSPSADSAITIGLGTSAIDGVEQTIANENTAPSSVIFSTAAGAGNALSIGNLTPGQHKAVWIKRVIDPNASSYNIDSLRVRVGGDITI